MHTPLTHAPSHMHAYTHTDTLTDTHTCAHTHTHTSTHSTTISLAHSLTHARTHTHSLSFSNMYTFCECLSQTKLAFNYCKNLTTFLNAGVLSIACRSIVYNDTFNCSKKLVPCQLAYNVSLSCHLVHVVVGWHCLFGCPVPSCRPMTVLCHIVHCKYCPLSSAYCPVLSVMEAHPNQE